MSSHPEHVWAEIPGCAVVRGSGESPAVGAPLRWLARGLEVDQREHGEDLLGVSRLVTQATLEVATLVEGMHTRIGSGPAVLGRPLAGPVGVINGLIYGGIRAVTTFVGRTVERALAALSPLLSKSAPGPEREALLSALNCVIGDYLAATRNPLALDLRLRRGGRALTLTPEALRAALPDARPRVLVLVHGAGMNDLQWLRQGHDHGAHLEASGPYTSIYAHYNTGLHISTNGRALSGALEALVDAWPTPLESLVVMGHSMGGLVARSACAAAEQDGRRWRPLLRQLVCLGSPHHGAPLEQLGNLLGPLLGISEYSAPLRRLPSIRSAGVTDLRYGNVLDEHWEGTDRFAVGTDPRRTVSLPQGVRCRAVAATLSAPGAATLRSDGLVAVDSALGRHPDPALTLAFGAEDTEIVFGASHLDLLNRSEVCSALKRWLL